MGLAKGLPGFAGLGRVRAADPLRRDGPTGWASCHGRLCHAQLFDSSTALLISGESSVESSLNNCDNVFLLIYFKIFYKTCGLFE